MRKPTNAIGNNYIFTEDPIGMEPVTVNEGFEHCDRIFVTCHPDILNCNKDDEQNTHFYFNILEVIEE